MLLLLLTGTALQSVGASAKPSVYFKSFRPGWKLIPANGLNARTGVRLRISRRSNPKVVIDGVSELLPRPGSCLLSLTIDPSLSPNILLLGLPRAEEHSLNEKDRPLDLRNFSSLMEICFRRWRGELFSGDA